MKTRQACLLGLGFLCCAGSAFLACSSSSGTFGDGGTDSGANDSTTMFDVPSADGKGHMDRTMQNDAPPPSDGGSDGAITDSGLVGHCSPVNGPACDLVLQNCPAKQECVVINAPGAESGLGSTTQCQPITGTEHLAAGSACCPGGTNQCDPGLTCVGTTCAGDAGGGRCTPACCPAEAGVNTANCGSSPEGYVGVCDLSLTNPGGSVLYNCCTYESTCTVFVKPCGPGYSCLVQDKTGTSKCTQISEPDGSTAGLPSGSGCQYANECAPDLECITFLYADGGAPPLGTCSYLCYTGMGTPPFDAGVLKGTPGHGGCPAKQVCGAASFLPSWLGVCGP